MFLKGNAKSNQKVVSAALSIISSDLKIIGNMDSKGEIEIDGTLEGDIIHETRTIEPGAHLGGHCRRADASVFKVDSKINLVVSENEKKQSVS